MSSQKSGLMQRVPLIQTLVFLVAMLELFSQAMGRFADDPGLGWHLVTGKVIAALGVVPQSDPFLALPQGAASRPWISDQWLSDLIMHGLIQVGGFPLLYSTLAVLFLAAYFLILPSVLVRKGAPLVVALIAALLAFKLGEIHFLARGSLFGIICFSWLIALLYSAGSVRRKLPKLVLLFALWGNLHPSFVLGGIFLFLWTGEQIVRKSLPVAWGGALLLVAFLATVLNPYGLALHESVLFLGSNNYFMQLNEEWFSPNFKILEGKVAFLFIAAAFLGLLLQKERARLSAESLAFLIFLYLGLASVRLLPYTGMVSALFSLDRLIPFRERSPFKRLLGFSERSGGGFLAIILAGVVVITLCQKSVPFYNGHYGPSADRFPHQAIAFLRTLPETPTVVASPDWGGFITYESQGALQPVIDDRNTLLGEGWYKSFFAAMAPGSETFVPFLAQFKNPVLLLSKNSPLSYYLKDTGRAEVLYTDQISTVLRFR